MDAFYASVELLRYPELQGQPVVIGGGQRHQPEGPPGARRFARLKDYVGRGVITTCTYAARAFGARSGMGLMKAARLAPEAVLLPVDFERYRHYSRLFKAAVRTLAPRIEDRGIDEIYLDFGARPIEASDPWAEARTLARAIKEAVREATGLTCSIGLAPNKLIAKIASDLDKPDGLTLVREEDIPVRIWPLAVSKVNGIGPKATVKLEGLGIRTIGELAQADPQWLVAHFGQSYGAWLHAAAHGEDERPVVVHSEPKSISRETTFDRDLHAVRDREALSRIFTELCVQLAGDLERKGYLTRTIGIKLRFEDFRTVTRDHTIALPTREAAAIRRAAGECLKRVPLDKRLRLLGVRAGNLSRPGAAGADPALPALAAREPETLPLF